MAKVKVFNVGQGDSILLEPEEGCDFCGEVFLIDVGPGNLDITKQIDKNKKIHLILTHSHTDHINGLKFFWKDSFSQIEEIIVQEGIQAKLAMMPESVRYKLCQTLTKIINKGSSTMIAIVL